MNVSKKLVAVLFLAAMIGGLPATLSAQSVNARENRVVGLWDVQVTNLDCNTGAQVSAFRAMHKYELGGTAQIVPATNPALLSSHMGIWQHLGGSNYQLTVKMFRFDAAGNNIGWIVIKADVVIDEDATAYAGSGQATIFDTNGNPVAKTCPAFTGTRFVRE
jgi:hypothetical protein